MTRTDAELDDAYEAATLVAESALDYTPWDPGDGATAEGLRAVYELGRKDALAWTPTTEDREPEIDSYIAFIARNYDGRYTVCEGIQYEQHIADRRPWVWNNDDEFDTSVTHFIQLPPLPSDEEQNAVRASLKKEREESWERYHEECARQRLLDKEAKIRGIR